MNAPVDDISKFLDGSLEADKTDALEHWRGASPENEQYFQEMAYVWKSSSQSLKENQETLTIDTEAALATVHTKINETKIVPLKPRRFNVLAIAASLALLVAAVFAFQQLNQPPQAIEIYASADIGQTVTLPDASTVWLEPQSKLTYYPTYATARNIQVEGEVFMDVTRNEELPFTVESPNLTVEVLGTSFVIRDIDADANSHVTVLSGKVKVTATKTKKHVLLTKDMTAVYTLQDDDLTIASSAKSVNHLFSATQQLRFSKTTLSELINQLELHTKASIDLNNSALADCPFTGQFNTNDAEKILQRIQPIYNFTIQENAGKYTIMGGSCN